MQNNPQNIGAIKLDAQHGLLLYLGTWPDPLRLTFNGNGKLLIKLPGQDYEGIGLELSDAAPAIAVLSAYPQAEGAAAVAEVYFTQGDVATLVMDE